jgi:tRNA(Ile)-lysidine synthase
MAALIDIAKDNNCRLIATAHQKNDNAETIIQRLSRGTGFRGLGGIWPVRFFADEITFVRPLLCFQRDEIVEYLKQHDLKWRRDHTNNDCTFRRNYIRHRLMPALQQDCSDSIVEQLSKLACTARGYYRIVCKRADKLWPDLVVCDEDQTVLDLKLFEGEPQPVKVELIRRSLVKIKCGERYLSQQHYEGILQLAHQKVTGRTVGLPGGFVVRREYNKLIFSGRMGNLFAHAAFVSETAWAGEPAHPTTVEIPGQTMFGEHLIKATITDADQTFEKSQIVNRKSQIPTSGGSEWFDLDKIKPPLTVRFRRPGDRFVPLGQSVDKKIGKFLTAQRAPYRIREQVIIVADGEKIIWVWPVRISEQSKITDQTRKILQLQITHLNT